MRVRLKTILAGPCYRGRAGRVLDVDEVMAGQLVEGGYAEAADPVPAPSASEPSPGISLADLGITGQQAKALAAASLDTLQGLERYLAEGKRLTDVKGIKEVGQRQILGRIEQWRKSHPSSEPSGR